MQASWNSTPLLDFSLSKLNIWSSSLDNPHPEPTSSLVRNMFMLLVEQLCLWVKLHVKVKARGAFFTFHSVFPHSVLDSYKLCFSTCAKWIGLTVSYAFHQNCSSPCFIHVSYSILYASLPWKSIHISFRWFKTNVKQRVKCRHGANFMNLATDFSYHSSIHLKHLL